jgi:K+-sensing histidine kinase KdpD
MGRRASNGLRFSPQLASQSSPLGSACDARAANDASTWQVITCGSPGSSGALMLAGPEIAGQSGGRPARHPDIDSARRLAGARTKRAGRKLWLDDCQTTVPNFSMTRRPSSRAPWPRAPSRILGYTGALLLSIGAVASTKLLAIQTGSVFVGPPITAVVLAALYGGVGAGVFASALCTVGYRLWILQPTELFSFSKPSDAYKLASLVFISLLLSIVSGTLRSSLRALSDHSQELEQVASRLSLSQSVAAALAGTRTQADVARVILWSCLPAIGARVGSVYWKVGETLELIESVGHSPGPVEQWRRISTAAFTPLRDALSSREGLWFECREQLLDRYPELDSALDRSDNHAWAAIPLAIQGGATGVMGLAFSSPRSFSAQDRALVCSLAAQCAQAIDRARLYEAERLARVEAEKASARSGLLVSVATRLNAGEYRAEVLKAAVEGARELLGGDDGSLCLALPDGHRLRGAFEIVSAGRVDTIFDVRQWPHALEAVDSRRPVYFSRAEAAGAEPDRFARLGIEAALIAPLHSQERFIGILCVDYRQDRFSKSSGDFAVVEAIAGLCALAIMRTQTFEAAVAAEQEAKRLGDLQERRVAMVGHDLRTPLAVVSMGANVLRKSGHLEPSQDQVLARIARGADRMERLVRDLLDFTRVRHGFGLAVHRAPMRIGEACQRVISEFEQSRPERTVMLLIESDDCGEWDLDRMEQIVSNLLSNALQHGPRDAPVTLRVRGDAQEVELNVHNPGPPIPGELMPVLFEPFRRGQAHEAGQAHWGLGLFIVREIVRAHGGSVEASSRKETGTNFTVRLPRKPADSASPPPARPHIVT